MAEPTSTGIAIAAGAITITGSILGVQYDSLLAGLFGGLISLRFLPPMTIKQLASSLSASSLLAGFFSPVVTMMGEHAFPSLLALGNYTHIAAAAFLGMSSQVIIPRIFKLIESFEVKK